MFNFYPAGVSIAVCGRVLEEGTYHRRLGNCWVRRRHVGSTDGQPSNVGNRLSHNGDVFFP